MSKIQFFLSAKFEAPFKDGTETMLIDLDSEQLSIVTKWLVEALAKVSLLLLLRRDGYLQCFATLAVLA